MDNHFLNNTSDERRPAVLEIRAGLLEIDPDSGIAKSQWNGSPFECSTK
jgi:hypothetical protein